MSISERPEVLEAISRAEAELAELCGQRNAIAARMVEVVAGMDDEDLWQSAGARSLEHWVAWKCGVSQHHAADLVAMARRRDELTECFARFDEGVVSEDQMAAIAKRAPEGTDGHFADFAPYATVGQLSRALQLARRAQPVPAPAPAPEDEGAPDADEPPVPPESVSEPEPERRVSGGFDDEGGWGLRVRLGVVDGAVCDAALAAHLDALVQQWKRDRKAAKAAGVIELFPPPFPTLADAFVAMCEASLDVSAVRRPHADRTTVVLHVDVATKAGEVHLGPALTEAERRYLSCDATFETWFERDGTPIGCARTTRKIPRRVRRALERRAGGCCEVPGCGARRGLHAHHLIHWEDGGPTELWNLLLVCPHHHRLHHRGIITIRGPAERLVVLDQHGRPLSAGGLARPPSGPPPDAPRYRHASGERCQWRWYAPPAPRSRPDPPPSPN
ncbi:MAG TPA: DUF222 domain-containing protein [Acidimicrobiales bacterium]|nr:DUF222 domain-containing protein [Acidimicrobiales bacterium]